MRQHRYLNFILTVNAVLLSLFLWAAVVDRPLMAEPAHAQSGAPNPADQRNQMIRQLEAVHRQLREQNELLKSGKLKVEVTNLNDLRIVVEQPTSH